MKVVYTTTECPGFKSGGQLAVGQTLQYLDRCRKKFADFELTVISNEYFEFDGIAPDFVSNSKVHTFQKLVSIVFPRLVDSTRHWPNEYSEIFNSSDIIIQEFSRNCILPSRFSEKILVRWHNIEADYHRWSGNGVLRSLLKRYHSSRIERIIAGSAHKNIFLTNADLLRARHLYPLKGLSIVLPVALGQKMNREDIRHGEYALISGSLWHQGNNDSIKSFLLNIWRNSYSIPLIIAGSRPKDELIDLSKNFDNVEIVSNPEDMTPLFMNASFMIAPIDKGAGMKVKIAEALSFALPVISSEHAAIGYKTDACLQVCGNDNEWHDAIMKFTALKPREIFSLKMQALQHFEHNYSIDITYKKFEEFINE